MENQNHNGENLNDQIENNDDFDKIKELYETKRNNIYDKEKNLRELKQELKEIQTYMQSVCKHEFVRETVTSGPYREIAYICKKCNYWN
jgi:chromosome segregation ATPase